MESLSGTIICRGGQYGGILVDSLRHDLSINRDRLTVANTNLDEIGIIGWIGVFFNKFVQVIWCRRAEVAFVFGPYDSGFVVVYWVPTLVKWVYWTVRRLAFDQRHSS